MTGFFITWYGIFELSLLILTLLICLVPLGSYIARVYNGQYTILEPILGPIEDFFYKLIKVNEKQEMTWEEYASAVLIASFVGFVLLFLILKCQAFLPLNPEKFNNLPDDLAFNICASFITNTNWQSYAGESSLSYFSQMVGLTVQNFLSASMGIAVSMAFIRGIIRKNTHLLGNFWIDWIKGCLYILLPLSIVIAIALGTQGVIQNFNHYLEIQPLQSQAENTFNILDTRFIPGGPVASQEAIKMLGTNGGGFFNVSSAHPYENPTALSNFIEIFCIFLIPASLCYAFGVMVNNKKQDG